MTPTVPSVDAAPAPDAESWGVQIRDKGQDWAWLTPDGRETRLSSAAARWTREWADANAALIRSNLPGVAVRVKQIRGEATS